MTKQQIISAISSTGHDQLLKAQCISIIHEVYVESRLIPMPELLDKAAYAVGITAESAKCKNRRNENVRARQLFVYFGRSWYSLTQMGGFLSGRDHTTILHNINTAVSLYEAKDDLFLFDLANMERVLAGEEPLPMVSNEPVKRRVVVDNKTGQHYKRVAEAARMLNIQGHASIKELNRRTKLNRFEWKVLVN